MISCDKCGFGHKTFEEKAACKSWEEISATLPAPSLPEAVAGNASAPVGAQRTTFLSIFVSKISALYGIADDLAEQCEALEKEQRNA